MRARHAERRGLPSELPIDDIEPIRGFGRSWYSRGPKYWLLRGFLALMMMISLSVACAVEDRFLTAALSSPSATARAVMTVVLCLAFVASFVQPVRTFRTVEQRRRAGLLLRPDLLPGGGRRPAGAGGAGLGALVRTGNPVASAFFVLGVIGFFGWFVVAFIWALQREYGIEHDARLRLQQHLARVPVAPG